jgi:hypothetical protein
VLDQYLDALRTRDSKASEAFEQSLADEARLAATVQKRESRKKLQSFNDKLQREKASRRVGRTETFGTAEAGGPDLMDYYDARTDKMTASKLHREFINGDILPEVLHPSKVSVTSRTTVRHDEAAQESPNAYSDDDSTMRRHTVDHSAEMKSEMQYNQPAVQESTDNSYNSGTLRNSRKDAPAKELVGVSTGRGDSDGSLIIQDIALAKPSSSWTTATLTRSKSAAQVTADNIRSAANSSSNLEAVPWNASKTTSAFSNTAMSLDSLTFEQPGAIIFHDQSSPSSRQDSAVKHIADAVADVVPFDPSLSVSEILLDQPIVVGTNGSIRILGVDSTVETTENVKLPEVLKAAVPAYRRKSRFNFEDDSDEDLDANTEVLDKVDGTKEQYVAASNKAAPIIHSAKVSAAHDNKYISAPVHSPSPSRNHVGNKGSFSNNSLTTKNVKLLDQTHPEIKDDERAIKSVDLKSYFSGGKASSRSSDDYENDEFDVSPVRYPHDLGSSSGQRQLSPLQVYVEDEFAQASEYPRKQAQLSHTIALPLPNQHRNIDAANLRSSTYSSTVNHVPPTSYSNTQSSGGVNESWDYKQAQRGEDDVFDRSTNYFEDNSLINDEAAYPPVTSIRADYPPVGQSKDYLEASVDIDTSMSVVFDMDQFESDSKVSSKSRNVPSMHKDDVYNDQKFHAYQRPHGSRKDLDEDDEVIRSSVMDYLSRPNITIREQQGVSHFGPTSNTARKSTDNDEDDNVLLGTAKFSLGSGYNTAFSSDAFSADSRATTQNIAGARDRNPDELSESAQSVNMEISWEDDRKHHKTGLRKEDEGLQPSGAGGADPQTGGWVSGRASLDLVETARALDVFVSSLRLEIDDDYELPLVSGYVRIRYNLFPFSVQQIMVKLELAGFESATSSPIHASNFRHMPVNFSSRKFYCSHRTNNV